MIWRTLTMIGFGLTSGILGIMVGDREPPTVIDRTEVLTPELHPGESLRVRFEVFRRKSCYVRVERMLLDGESARFVLPTTELSGAPGPLGKDMYISVVPIPSDVHPGLGRYRAITTYKCNPMHSLWPIIAVADDVTFTIL